MKADSRFLDLIERIQGGHLMTREECAYLIGFGETSLEASIESHLIAIAAEKSRKTGLPVDIH